MEKVPRLERVRVAPQSVEEHQEGTEAGNFESDMTVMR